MKAELGAFDSDVSSVDSRALPRSDRDRVVDFVLFSFAVIATAAIAVNGHARAGTARHVIYLVLAGIACLSLWARRQNPVGVACVAVVLSAISRAAVPASLVAVMSAGIHARPRQAVQITAGAIAAMAVDCAIYTQTPPWHDSYDWNTFALLTAAMIAALTFGSFIRVRRELVLSLHERARRLESEQERSYGSARRSSPNAPGSHERCTMCSRTGSRC